MNFIIRFIRILSFGTIPTVQYPRNIFKKYPENNSMKKNADSLWYCILPHLISAEKECRQSMVLYSATFD